MREVVAIVIAGGSLGDVDERLMIYEVGWVINFVVLCQSMAA
jgi:hypothetical protein